MHCLSQNALYSALIVSFFFPYVKNTAPHIRKMTRVFHVFHGALLFMGALGLFPSFLIVFRSLDQATNGIKALFLPTFLKVLSLAYHSSGVSL